jgi:hypothetical protein
MRGVRCGLKKLRRKRHLSKEAIESTEWVTDFGRGPCAGRVKDVWMLMQLSRDLNLGSAVNSHCYSMGGSGRCGSGGFVLV